MRTYVFHSLTPRDPGKKEKKRRIIMSDDESLPLGHWLDDVSGDDAAVDGPPPALRLPKLTVPIDCDDEYVSLKAVGGLSTTTRKHDQSTCALAKHVFLSGCGTCIKLIQQNGEEVKLEGTGGAAWGAAPALCTVLASRFVGADFSGMAVVELGAGTGAVGLWIAKRWPTSRVILTDLPEAVGLMTRNVVLNELTCNCVAAALPFGEDVPSLLARLGAPGGGAPEEFFGTAGRIAVDAVIVSDCLYSQNAKLQWRPLAASIFSALRSPSTPAMAFPARRSSCEMWVSVQERHGCRGAALDEFLEHMNGLDVGGTGLCASSVQGICTGLPVQEDSLCSGVTTSNDDAGMLSTGKGIGIGIGSSSFVEVEHPSTIAEGAPFHYGEYRMRIFRLQSRFD